MTNKIGVTNPVQPVTKTVQDPDHTLAIVGLALTMFFSPLGLIVSMVALSQSKKRGYENTLALAGIVINALLTALFVLLFVIVVIFIAKFDGVERQFQFESSSSQTKEVYID